MKNCSNTVFVAFLTVVYILFFVAFVWVRQWQVAGDDRMIFLPYLLLNIVASFVQIFCFFYALTVSRFLFILSLPLVFCASVFHDYMVGMFNVPVNEKTISVVFEATSNEVTQFLTLNLLLLILCGVISAFLIGLYFCKKVIVQEKDKRVAKTFAAITACLILAYNGAISVSYPPYNIITSSVNYTWDRLFQHVTMKKPEGYSYPDKDSEPLKIVLIIGESARADHFSLNGYNRETNIYTSKRKNVISFKNAISCGALTRIAVPCILTSSNDGETSLLGVFNSLGFYTKWLGAQGAFSTNDPISNIINEAHSSVLLEKQKMLDNSVFDEELLPYLDKELADKTNRDMFTVLHLYGSHWQYQARYPKQFGYFTPVCEKTYMREFVASDQIKAIKECADIKSIVNAYDNSIIYTDYIVDQVMDKLADKNAVVIYMSDHGESLGEGGRYLHGNFDAPEQRHIPLLWWESDKFIAKHHKEWEYLSSRTGVEFKQNMFFSNFLNCLGIKSDSINKEENICAGDPIKHLQL